MFKANLIEGPAFYSSRRLNLIYFFLAAIPGALVFNYLRLNMWVAIPATLLYLVVLFLGFRNARKLRRLSHQRIIELDESTVRIKSKGKLPLLEFPLNSIQQITISRDVGIPQESMKDIVKEMSGEPKENFIIISREDQQERFDFIIDSYYMLRQLESVTDAWGKRGFLVRRV